MNCKFCGNFIPENNDSCLVCGRRQDEEPIGKLLSDNLPQNVAATEAAERAAAKKSDFGERRQSLTAPILALVLSAAGWIYCLANNVFETLKTLYNNIFGAAVQPDPEGNFVVPGAFDGLSVGMLIIAGLLIVFTVIGVWALISLIKRLANNYRYNH